MKRLEATDASKRMMDEARKHTQSARVHFSTQDAASLPYAPESFDAVVIANALHVLPRPDMVSEEIARVLKPGGLLIAPTFVHGEEIGFRVRTGMIKLVGFMICRRWSVDEFVAFVSDRGFSVTQQQVMESSIAPCAVWRRGKSIRCERKACILFRNNKHDAADGRDQGTCLDTSGYPKPSGMDAAIA